MVVLGLWTPYFYVATYGISHGMSARLANYLFALINAGSLVGRIAGGFLAGWAGQFNVITMSCYISAILVFIWLGVTSTAGLIVLAILFGASSGIIIALMMSTIAHTADHPSKVCKAHSAVLLMHVKYRAHCRTDNETHRSVPTSDNRPLSSASPGWRALPSQAHSSANMASRLGLLSVVRLFWWALCLLLARGTLSLRTKLLLELANNRSLDRDDALAVREAAV
jgi:hypothetical protein